jgi:predicted nucleic acid-binding protein
VTKTFADSFFYFAIVSGGDAAHQRADEFARSYTGETVTTAWVLTEFADGMARPVARRVAFENILLGLRTDPATRIIGPSDGLMDEGIALYTQRKDKEWSLTDCISFVVMQREGITDALTGDHHFEQAGFRALLKA